MNKSRALANRGLAERTRNSLGEQRHLSGQKMSPNQVSHQLSLPMIVKREACGNSAFLDRFNVVSASIHFIRSHAAAPWHFCTFQHIVLSSSIRTRDRAL